MSRKKISRASLTARPLSSSTSTPESPRSSLTVSSMSSLATTPDTQAVMASGGMREQEMAAIAPVKSFLELLPAEVVCMIFEFAYPEVVGFRLIEKPEWERKEKRAARRDKTFSARPFCSFAAQWLVSRSYFVYAARAWTGAQDWTTTAQRDAPGAIEISSKYSIVGILLPFIRKLTVDDTELRRVRLSGSWIKNVKHLTVVLGTLAIGNIGDKEAKFDEYEDADFADHYMVEAITYLARLPVCVIKEGTFQIPSRRKPMRTRNFKVYVDFVRRELATARSQRDSERNKVDTDGVVATPLPLYTGSAVRWSPGPVIVESLTSRSPSSSLDNPRKAHQTPLEDGDIPETEVELMRLVRSKGNLFVDWVKNIKLRANQ